MSNKFDCETESAAAESAIVVTGIVFGFLRLVPAAVPFLVLVESNAAKISETHSGFEEDSCPDPELPAVDSDPDSVKFNSESDFSFSSLAASIAS